MNKCTIKIVKIATGTVGFCVIAYFAYTSGQHQGINVPFHATLVGAGSLVSGLLLATGFHTPRNFKCQS